MYFPRYHPTGKGGDLTYMKSIASPLEQILGSNAPIIGLYFFPPIVKYRSNPPDPGHVHRSNTIKSPPFASGVVGGAIH